MTTMSATMSTTTMRRILTASAFVSALVVAAPAHADERPVPRFSELPTSGMSSPPRASAKIPRVAARESVPGFFVARTKDTASAMGRRMIVVGDVKRLAEIEKQTGGFSDERASTCFAVDNRGRRMEIDADQPAEWDAIGATATLWTKNGDNPSSGVAAVHMERITVAADGATASLEWADAWIDPASRGARLIAKSTLALTQIGTAPDGGKIFAGRDERADGRRAVQFVIVRPQDGLGQQRGRAFARRLDGDLVQESGCAHFRIGVPVTKEGDSALVSMTIVLPSLDGKPNPTLEQLAGGAGRASRTKRTSGAVTLVASPDVPAAPEERDLRLRDAGIQLSVSQTSRDKEPIVSVSHRWIARERTQRVFLPPSTPE
jgi:hypothetical protein